MIIVRLITTNKFAIKKPVSLIFNLSPLRSITAFKIVSLSFNLEKSPSLNLSFWAKTETKIGANGLFALFLRPTGFATKHFVDICTKQQYNDVNKSLLAGGST